MKIYEAVYHWRKGVRSKSEFDALVDDFYGKAPTIYDAGDGAPIRGASREEVRLYLESLTSYPTIGTTGPEVRGKVFGEVFGRHHKRVFLAVP